VAEVLRPDLCVIGAGSGGLSVAAASALFGVPVVLIERERMGGDCLNVGCVPSKALIAAAGHAQAMRRAKAFGVVGEPKIDFAAVHAHVQGVIAAIAPNDSVERFTAMGVEVIRAEARFVGRRLVEAGGKTIRARRTVLAVGSRPAAPPIDGLEDVLYFTNETIFDLKAAPSRLVVIGGGPIGLELAQAYRRLGSEVVVLEAARLLGRDDPEMAEVARLALERDGVVIRQGVRIVRVEPMDAGIRVVLDAGGETIQDEDQARPEEAVEGSHLLVAVGRRPSLEALNLRAAGIKHDQRGIIVDARLKTSNRRVYAIGDCISGPHGGLQFTHVSNYHAGLVIRSALFRQPVRVDNAAIPRVTYTDPEIASVGLSEDEARKRHRRITILRWPFAENDRAQTERYVTGHIKVVTTGKGVVVGVSIAGPQAGELIVPWVMAVKEKRKVSDFANVVFAYPTLSEVSKRAALSYLVPSAAKPAVRGLVGFLRKFG
jgi:pyruvate/2-oxoglutarate dehydrogenase complex dihydrolipoamide dehydrogenase (E3) component